MQDMLLMMKDIPVMRINFDTMLFQVINKQYLPFQIQGKLSDEIAFTGDARYDAIQMNIAFRKDYNAVISFLSTRVLPLDRENAKKILSLLCLEQLQTPEYRARIAIMCRAVSLQDNYWVKTEGDAKQWKDVDLRQNRLSEIIAQVALHGSSLTLQGEFHTPELTTNGAYAKCWKRVDDDLYLYKKGYNGNTESKIEIEVSNLLDKCNVNHLRYEKAMSHGAFCCRCKCMTSDSISMLSGMDFFSYCNVNNMDGLQELMNIDADSIYKMLIVDYLISNRDRHGMNWGLFYDCDTMQIIGCHPLYDHNNSFDRELMRDITGGKSLFYNDMTMQQAAHWGMRHTDFHFLCPITRDDFLVDSHYRSFMSRARDLGLEIREEAAGS